MIKVVYGSSRYASVWDTDTLEKAAMKLWAPDILKYTDSQLSEKLAYAKQMSYLQAWKFPDVGQILQGDRQEGASGQAALSYRHVSEVMALPKIPTPESKAVGQAFLATLKANLRHSTADTEKQRTEDYSEN